MSDPIFILSYVIFFAGTFAIAAYLMTLDRHPVDKDHPAHGE